MKRKRPPALLRRIALEVREWAEAIQSEDLGENLNWNMSLRGACAVTSFRLWEKLKEEGFKKVDMVHGHGHAFLLWDDYSSIRIARQFFD